jgi:hypothetical protein
VTHYIYRLDGACQSEGYGLSRPVNGKAALLRSAVSTAGTRPSFVGITRLTLGPLTFVAVRRGMIIVLKSGNCALLHRLEQILLVGFIYSLTNSTHDRASLFRKNGLASLQSSPLSQPLLRRAVRGPSLPPAPIIIRDTLPVMTTRQDVVDAWNSVQKAAEELRDLLGPGTFYFNRKTFDDLVAKQQHAFDVYIRTLSDWADELR